MSAACQNCGKHVSAGRSRQHRRGVAGKRWSDRVTASLRKFSPNLQSVTMVVDGRKVHKTLCSKCIKRAKKDAAAAASI